jgi:FkbM family methyltransferase
MYLEHLVPRTLAIAAAPRCFVHRLRHPELVSFGLLANLVRLSSLPALQGIEAIVDVGANIGQFAYMASVAWPKVPIHSFEPDPRVHARLAETFRRFGLVGTTHAKAVGATDGVVQLHVQPESTNSSLLERHEDASVERIDVACTTLDREFAQRFGRRSVLLKVDTQGSELEVLRGGSKLLQHCSAVLLEASVRSSYAGGVQLPELLLFMRDAGFVPLDIVDVLRLAGPDRALCELDLLFVPLEPQRK